MEVHMPQKVIKFRNTTIVLFEQPIGGHHGMQLLKDKFYKFLTEDEANSWRINFIMEQIKGVDTCVYA
jgi:hypothetical protein